MGVFRFFYSSARTHEMAKNALAALRKKTGYTFANCRKALEMHNNDPAKAEDWLREQAKALGWNAAMKVQSRRATQGLIGVAINNKKVAMVELNCETDFVSRNEKFKEMVDLVTSVCLKYPVLNPGEDTKEVNLNAEELAKLKIGNETLADHMAVLISGIGENMLLRRAYCYETQRNDINLAVSVHPPCSNSSVLHGKYAAFIVYQRNASNGEDTDGVSNEICKHIIGMNPTKIGDYETDEPCKNASEEPALIHQEFLSDESKTVGDFLKESGIKLLTFQRFECGEEEANKTSNESNEKETEAKT
ncbi:hypothetical protein RUM44_003715 [Polyplax serrata]|uniref:Elongation factor Ts, mitochondrial n=1 Tax=Polyplax serrata TaxID=468196 RepID=A0ABR1AH90_POLSC